MATIELTKDNFEEVVTKNDMVIIDFLGTVVRAGRDTLGAAPFAGTACWGRKRLVKEKDEMATVELTKDNFEEVVTKNDMVIIDFWAPWCGPCKGFAPVFESAADKNPGVVFAKVNTDVEQELAGHFSIRSIPTLMVFREKVIVFSQAGALPASGLVSVIEQAQALDMAQVHKDVAEQQAQQQQQ